MNTKPGTKKALQRWEKLRKSIRSSTPIDPLESSAAKARRVQGLLDDWEAFCYYYFPGWCAAPFSDYHRQWARAWLSGKYYRLALEAYRGFSKTTFQQMLMIYEACKGDFRYCVWASKNWTAAAEMIETIKIQFEENLRLVHDFGDQRNIGAWETGYFTLRSGATFKALGRGQSPRGTKVNEARPDRIIKDDLDDDELVRSKEQLDKAHDWDVGALYNTVDISKPYKVAHMNNRLAEDCLLTRFIQTADYHLAVNILDDEGNPTWPERFTLEQIQRHMAGISAEHIRQAEFFNNPVIPGTTFKQEWIQWKRLPPLQHYRYLVAYLDPSFSERKHADHKAWPLVGLWRGEIHIIKAYCDVATINQMVSWGYEIEQYVKGRNGAVMLYMEEVFFQALLYKDFQAAAKKLGRSLPLRGDTRKKPQKDARIMATSGDFERGVVYFNQAERNNHHMQNLVNQFLLFQPGNTRIKKDGPDAYEGAVHLLKELVFQTEPIKVGKRTAHKYNW